MNAKKIRPPSQTTSDNNMRNRRNDMSEIIELVGRFHDCGGVREFLRASTIEYDFVLILTLGDCHATQSECSVEGWP
jgi:hypothetical protein